LDKHSKGLLQSEEKSKKTRPREGIITELQKRKMKKIKEKRKLILTPLPEEEARVTKKRKP